MGPWPMCPGPVGLGPLPGPMGAGLESGSQDLSPRPGLGTRAHGLGSMAESWLAKIGNHIEKYRKNGPDAPYTPIMAPIWPIM